MTLAEAEKLILTVLKSNMEEKISNENVEIMFVRTSTRKWERRTAQELEALISTLA
jgi:20S proteasome alpha/beta subunit